MAQEKLKEGTHYKYGELCFLLGLEPKTSSTNSKRAQEKTISTLVDFEKVGKGKGTKYLVTKIHSIPRKKEDKRALGNNNDISTHIQYALLCFLKNIERHDNNGEGVGLNRFYIYKSLGMTNEKFCSEYINRSDMMTIECFDYTYQRLYSRLDSALNSYIKKSSGFTVSNGYRFYTKDSLGTLRYKTADKDEEGMISDVEDCILQELGIKNKRDLLFVKHGEEAKYPLFKQEVVKRLRQDFPIYFSELENYGEALVFGYTTRAILRIKERLETDYGFSEDTIKQKLNDLLVTSLDGTIKRRHSKAKKEEHLIDTLSPMKKKIHIYRSSPIYVEEQTRVKNNVVKIKNDQLSFEDYVESENLFV